MEVTEVERPTLDEGSVVLWARILTEEKGVFFICHHAFVIQGDQATSRACRRTWQYF